MLLHTLLTILFKLVNEPIFHSDRSELNAYALANYSKRIYEIDCVRNKLPNSSNNMLLHRALTISLILVTELTFHRDRSELNLDAT